MATRSSSARRYAEAAFEIAQRDGTVEAWQDALRRTSAALADERVARLARSPTVPLAARQEMIQAAAGGGLPRPVMNLVILLLRRRRIDLIPRVGAEFQRLVDRHSGITRAVVTSTAPLSDDDARALADRLVLMTGGTVEMSREVDPSLLGGVVVRIGDRLIDGSVRGRLERLRSQLASGAF